MSVRRVAADVPGGDEEIFLIIDTAADGSVHQGGVGAFKSNGHKIRVRGSVGAEAVTGSVGSCDVELRDASGAWIGATFEDTTLVEDLEDPFLISIPALDRQIEMDWASKRITMNGIDMKIETRRNANGTKAFGIVARNPRGPCSVRIRPDADAVVLRDVRATKVEDADSERDARAERRRRWRELEAGDGHGKDSATAKDVDDNEDESKDATGAKGDDDCEDESKDGAPCNKDVDSKIAKRTAAKPRRPEYHGKRCKLVHRATGHSSLRMSQRLLMRSDAIASKQGRSKLRAAVTTCATCDSAKMSCRNRSGRVSDKLQCSR